MKPIRVDILRAMTDPFTTEEVEALQMILSSALVTGEMEAYGVPAVRDRVQSVIAKIKALLPPDSL